MDKYMCSLCGMAFDDDYEFQLRKEVHDRWHSNCKKEKRNTTEGKVDWIFQGEPKPTPEHEHQLETIDDECHLCGSLSIIYDYCRECGYYETLRECNCLVDELGGEDVW